MGNQDLLEGIPPSVSGELVRKLVQDLGVRLRAKQDQHFLVDDEVIRELADAAEVGSSSHVLEVGAGAGQITQVLMSRGARVMAYEIDARFAPLLDPLAARGCDIRYADALEGGWDEVNCIVANLPFSISEPFAHKLCLQTDIGSGALIVGFRLADCLRPESRVTKIRLLLECHYQIEILKRVPRAAFYPSPPQEAALIRLTRLGSEGGTFRQRFWRRFFRNPDTSVHAAINRSMPKLKRGKTVTTRELGIPERVLSQRAGNLSNQHIVGMDLALRSLFTKKRHQRDTSPTEW